MVGREHSGNNSGCFAPGPGGDTVSAVQLGLALAPRWLPRGWDEMADGKGRPACAFLSAVV